MSSQDYTLTFEEREDYLWARLEGRDSFAASLSYWNDIADRVVQLETKKLLVYENLVGEVSEAEMFELIADLQSSGLIGVRVAIVDDNTTDKKINQFGQLVAGNRGGNIQLFESIDAAEAWLQKDA